MERRYGERLFENFDFLVELLQFAIADALEIERVRVSRVEFDGLLKAGATTVCLSDPTGVGKFGSAKTVSRNACTLGMRPSWVDAGWLTRVTDSVS